MVDRMGIKKAPHSNRWQGVNQQESQNAAHSTQAVPNGNPRWANVSADQRTIRNLNFTPVFIASGYHGTTGQTMVVRPPHPDQPRPDQSAIPKYPNNAP